MGSIHSRVCNFLSAARFGSAAHGTTLGNKPMRMTVTYRVRADAASIEERAQAIAVEQSVETPLSAIADERVLRDIVGEVQGVRELEPRLFEVRIGLAVETTGFEAGQLLAMLFGNSSLQDDVTLIDADIPDAMAAHFGGPRVGVAGLRATCGAGARALTCTAVKPQGMPVAALAELAGRLAAGGVDFLKDDHGLADQAYSPFSDRVRAIAEAVRRARGETGSRTLYVPSVTGCYEAAASQIALAIEEGLEAVMVEPMILGVSNFHRLVNAFPGMAFFAPSGAGERVAHRAAAAAWQAVSSVWRGCDHLSELWRTI